MLATCDMCTTTIRPVAETPGLIAMPTLGCFVPGYLLIIPRQHVLSFGQLDTATLAEADGLITALSARLAAVYDTPILGFENGNNLAGARRIQHAHWHLLPSPAGLREHLDQRLAARRITALTDLPHRPDTSYIAVRDQQGDLSVYEVPHETARRSRLRRLVADLDPRIDADTWDWASHGFLDVVRQTIADLSRVTADSPTSVPASPPAGDHALR